MKLFREVVASVRLVHGAGLKEQSADVTPEPSSEWEPPKRVRMR